jgi:hypothetical protein
MARGFGATRGSASTDRINTAVTAHGTLRTYAFWAKANSYDDFMRVFDKFTSGSSPESIQYQAAVGNFAYARNRATTAGTWIINTSTIATGTWAHYALTYDAGSTSNDPIWYRNGAAISTAETSTPNGAVTTNAHAYMWGNRGTDNARVFNGDLAEMAIWDAVLDASEIASLYRGWRADRIRPASLVSYIDAIRDVRDKAGAPTVTGTAVREHPFFIGAGSILLPNKGAGGALNDYELIAEHGAFAESGQDATLLRSRIAVLEHGSFSLSGQDATLATPDRVLGADTGSYSLAGQDATLDYVETDPAPVAPPVQVGGGGRSRVYFEVWKNVPLFEAETEQEARKVVKAIKKKLRRQIHRLERGQAPDVALPDVSEIRMTGPDSIVEAMAPQFREVIDLAHAYQRLADEMDEDDVESLLL